MTLREKAKKAAFVVKGLCRQRCDPEPYIFGLLRSIQKRGRKKQRRRR